MLMSYLSVHNHTHYSNIRMLDCIIKEDKLIDHAHKMGLKGVCLTDHESVGGHIKAIKHMKKRKEENPEEWKDFKLGLGNEIYLTRDGLSKENYTKGKDGFWHFILVAKDKEGHKQLRELSSRAWDHTFRTFMERVPTYYRDFEEIILPNKGHLIATTACLGGQFPNMLLEAHETRNFSKIDSFINWCLKIFGNDFYIEIQPGTSDEQKWFNKEAVAYALANNIRWIVSTDTHYLRKEDRPVHKSFLNAGSGDREVDEFYQFCYMMSPAEIVTYLEESIDTHFAQEALDNTLEIYDKIGEYDLAHAQIIPRIPLDWDSIPTIWNNPEATSVVVNAAFAYPNISLFLNSDHEEDRFFIQKIIERGNQRGILDEPHLQRINDECGEIWEVSEKINERLSAYFIIIQKVVDLGWTDGDSIVGPWRGSAGALLTAYLLDIIQGDPLNSPIDLPYWRCISKDRVELADFDLDFQASKREKVIGAIRNYVKSIGGETVSVCTYGTETLKSAFQTACRGLGYEPELGTMFSSLVPIDRGFVRNLKQCIDGDDEKGYKPVKALIDEMRKYPDVLEVVEQIEGLISRRGVHAAGILITNNKFTELNATMRSAKGALTSQWELYDSEYVGNIKFDLLTVDALDRIRTTMELLSEYGYIEWQGSLKDTYIKYLSPNKIDYETEEMWEMVGNNKIISLFQFDTPVGLECAKQIRPRSLLELAQANSLMRLMPEGKKETPVQEFVKYKENPQLIKREINSLVATAEEKQSLYDFMIQYGGVLDSQESLMLATMLPFTNYSRAESNKVRKVVAKKKMKEIEQTREDYYARGHELGTSEDVLRYIWNVQAARQMGYSFSIIHTIGYSTIAVQEMNLAYHYPEIFWNTACLIVDSAGIEDDDEEIEDVVEVVENITSYRDFEQATEEDSEDAEEDDEDDTESGPVGKRVSKPKKVVNYGKISSAINKMKQFGIDVLPPDINKSKFTFIPDVANNQIIYGVKGITRIGDDLAEMIIANRPYVSLDDFKSKVKATKLQIINLIKCGAFDSIESRYREDIMYDYIKGESGCKSKLTLQNMSGLINSGVIPADYAEVVKVYNFNKYLKKNKDSESYVLDGYAQEYYNERFDTDLLYFDGDKCMIVQKTWDKIYKKEMEKIRSFLNEPSTLEAFNQTLIQDLWDKYCDGPISKWEMDSIGFYNGAHELDGIRYGDYDIVDFYMLSEEPEVVYTFTTKEGNQVPMFELFRIAGTVIEKNKLKSTITLLTPNGVAKVKIFPQARFAKYDKQLYIKDEETGKKKITERSWFTRGNKLVISGIRRGDSFVPKAYKNYKYDYSIGLIEDIDYTTGAITIKTERYD